jgi:hypothetical protein
MIRQDQFFYSRIASNIVDYEALAKLVGCSGTAAEMTDEAQVTYRETIKPVTPESICGREVRPGWLSLRHARSILLDGLSIDDMVNNEYSRFRSFLFDSGYIPIKCKIADHPREHLVYARSSLLSDPSLAGASGRRSVGMKFLGNHGRFGNQLWQYLFIRMYGLRNGLTVKVPAWEGERLFGFSDARPSDDDQHESMIFFGLDDDDLELWEIDDAPGDVDFKGYFQNVPSQWGVHREFMRRLYTLNQEWGGATAQLNLLLNREGRTLVTIHVRRGDYRTYNHAKHPLFRLVPTHWYRALLDKIWPSLARPVLHVSTDEPETIKPEFDDYEQLDVTFFARDFGIPEHVRDFVLLQESDYLAACNSSFSTMAAVVGKPGQKSYLVDFRTQGFTPYDPWMESSFGARFVQDSRNMTFAGYGVRGARKRGLMARSVPAGNFRLLSEVERLRQRSAYLEDAFQQIVNSTSWKLTWPLRWAISKVIGSDDIRRRKLRAVARVGWWIVSLKFLRMSRPKAPL